jgi:hypothetical protein
MPKTEEDHQKDTEKSSASIKLPNPIDDSLHPDNESSVVQF